MTLQDWIPWISFAISLGVPFALFVGRNWLKARIEKGVEHRFNTEIEAVRSELRKSEERFKSELSVKESEMSAIRSTVLGGSANRQALVDKRRLEAVERVWATVIDLGPYKNNAANMALIKIGPSSKRAANDPKVREFFKTLGSGLPVADLVNINASKEQPFVSALAFAYYSAYRTVIASSLVMQKGLETGMDNVDEMLDKGQIRKIMKAALPEHSKYIDEKEPNVYYHLLEKIEDRLLNELKSVLEGKDADRAGVTKASEIMSAVNELNVAAASKGPDATD